MTTRPTPRDPRDVPPTAAPRASEQAAVVAGYVVAATAAGVPIEGRARAMIAGQAGRLLDDGWRVEEILRAVDRFARRRRFAGHLAQWCRENAMDERESVHAQRKRADPRDGGLHALADAMRKAGL